MNRRDFLRIPLNTDMPIKTRAEPLPVISVPSAGYPHDYTRHVPVLVNDVRAWLVRDEIGFYAIDAVCPHLGGMVRIADKAFACPCHASVFAPDGTIVSGPAHHPLRYLRVDMDEIGQLVIQRDQTVLPDDRFIA